MPLGRIDDIARAHGVELLVQFGSTVRGATQRAAMWMWRRDSSSRRDR